MKTKCWCQAWHGIHPSSVYTHFEYIVARAPFAIASVWPTSLHTSRSGPQAYTCSVSYCQSIPLYIHTPSRDSESILSTCKSHHGPQTHYCNSIQQTNNKTKKMNEYTTQYVYDHFQISNGLCLSSFDCRTRNINTKHEKNCSGK